MAPTNKRELCQFLGLAGYFRRFIAKFAIKTAPLTDLLRKNAVFEWKERHELIRQEIIKNLTNEPILEIYNPELELELHTDDCAQGVAGILFQQSNKTTHPIAYFSRKTNEYESKYHSYDLKTLAIVEAVRYFRVYLYGRHFKVFTDCNAVRATALKKELHPRVARWWVQLQDYDFDIEYRPGSKMLHVDYLSRNAVVCRVTDRSKLVEPLLTMEQYQAVEEVCKQVLQKALPPSEQHQYEVKNGLVYRRLSGGKVLRCFVPEKACLRVLRAYHDESAHIGTGKMIAKLKETLYWPRMAKSARKYVGSCRACVLGKSHTGVRRGLFQLGQKAGKPLDMWHIDHVGPLVRSRGCTQILVIIDAFPKYCKLVPVSKKTSKDAIVALDRVFTEIGVPNKIIADRGTAFTSMDFKEFLEAFGCDLHLIATGVPRGNGVVERQMRTIFNMMRATLTAEKEKAWTTVLPKIESSINNTISTTTNATPMTLMFSVSTQLEATGTLLKNLEPPVIDVKELSDLVKRRSDLNYNAVVNRLNAKRKPAKSFMVGDRVVVEDTQAPSRGKLGLPYKGPYVIKKLLPHDRYCLSKGGKRETVAARDQLRLWPDDVTNFRF